jgi:hypothetical protein
MDGTTLRVPDSPANREHFGAQAYASGKVASYPQVPAVTLTAIPTHLVADIDFGRYDTNEIMGWTPPLEAASMCQSGSVDATT